MRVTCGIRPLGAVVLLLCLFVGGCEKSKITKSNFDQIQIGTAYPDVQKLLGGPGQPAGSRVIGELQGGRQLSAQIFRWKSGGAIIELEFTHGKVSKKSSSGL